MRPGGRVLLARPRGFCAGVERAVAVVEEALATHGAPVWVRHAIVHNAQVVERLRRRGARFVETLDEVPRGALVVFSAHGVSPAVRTDARERGLRVIDATCPLVAKVHLEVLRFAREGFEILLVGHRGHVEVEGTAGHAPERVRVVDSAEEAERVAVVDPARVAVLTQTTLSVEDTREIVAVLRRRFPALRTPARDDICYATHNRQAAVKALAKAAGLVLVVGSATSSNTNRLVEVARAAGADAHRLEEAAELDARWLRGHRCVGVTAGASAPEESVRAVVRALAELGFDRVSELPGREERVAFALPATTPEALAS